MALIKVRKPSFPWISALFKAVELRDFLIFGGISMLGYGLWMLYPWLGWTATGTIFLCLGLFVGKRGE
jgi:hypothetical protein